MATTAEYLTQLQTDKATLVTNLVAKGVDATNDETFTSLVPKVADISTGGGTEPTFTGSYDAEGLKQIGWTDEEIDYYNQNGVQWNASEDEYFKLTTEELAGDTSTNTRFLPKNSTKKSFESYYKLLAIPQLDTSKVTTMRNMFKGCYSLTTIPQLNTSEVTNMETMFRSCSSLTMIPQLSTSKVTTMRSMFSYCSSLTTIPQLDTSKVTNMETMFTYCDTLSNLGGFLNLGKAYQTSQSANYYNYTLNLVYAKVLTEQSMINILNNLYDIKTKGCQPQKVALGSTNLAKLVSEEGQQALQTATERGWNIS